MRALVLDNGQVRYREDVPEPDPPSGHALIRVRRAGICATDLQLIRGLYPFNGILGHEFIGTVESVNEDGGHSSLRGKRVAGEINLACHDCDMCRAGMFKHCRKRRVLGIRQHNGAFADFITLPLANLHTLPDQIDDDAAVFLEPLAAVFDILEKVDISSRTSVAIVGDGRIAQLAARVLLTRTSRLIVFGKHQTKLNRLPKSVSGQLNVEADQYRSFDVIVECSGNVSGFSTALDLVKPGGEIVLKSTSADSLSFEGSTLVVNEISVRGSRCGDFSRALEYLCAEQKNDQGLASLVDRHFRIEAGLDALAYARNNSIMKVVLDME